ncbi:palmdelphin-like isoform X2 [Dicentrarchus labrax]|nr:palmdelphin-like isoform X2 [Dicentrarchus labrax]
MEEADLLKERLQAITDKRRIQESIAMKRRQIEEEKLKLQYIKKKALREQWLMDGLSQQSEEEQEAMRLQAQDEQQQSDQLQSNIFRIEKEIEALETQELNISANEEVVLKRLKEVERTAEDIIKELNAEFHADLTHHVNSPLPDIPSFIPLIAAKTPPIHEPGGEKPKKATFAMEISVELDKRTGKSQVVSIATITPETIQDRGLKVYDDGRKSVYALHPDGCKMLSGAVGEMTPTEVEELLHQATEKNVPTGVQYHQPVYSVPYTGSSRPSTPRAPNKTQRLTPTRSPSPFQSAISSRNGAQIHREENQRSQDLEGQKTPSPSHIQQDSMTKVQRHEEIKQPFFHIPGQPNSDRHQIPQPHFGAKTPRGLTSSKWEASSPNSAALVSVKARSEGMPAPMQPVYRDVDSPSLASHKSEVDQYGLIESSSDFNRHSPFCTESIASLNLVNTLPQELESEPITMIFMGFENAEDAEEEDIQAELVIISNSDDDEAQYDKNENDEQECLSFHPEGYKSQVFQPKVGVAKVTGCRDIIKDSHTNWDDLGLHTPTFIHKPGKHSPYLHGQGADESANTGSINMEKMKLCSTGR